MALTQLALLRVVHQGKEALCARALLRARVVPHRRPRQGEIVRHAQKDRVLLAVLRARAMDEVGLNSERLADVATLDHARCHVRLDAESRQLVQATRVPCVLLARVVPRGVEERGRAVHQRGGVDRLHPALCRPLDEPLGEKKRERTGVRLLAYGARHPRFAHFGKLHRALIFGDALEPGQARLCGALDVHGSSAARASGVHRRGLGPFIVVEAH